MRKGKEYIDGGLYPKRLLGEHHSRRCRLGKVRNRGKDHRFIPSGAKSVRELLENSEQRTKAAAGTMQQRGGAFIEYSGGARRKTGQGPDL